MKLHFTLSDYLRFSAALCFLIAPGFYLACAQEAAQKPAENLPTKSAASTAPELPAQIELLETRVRFEAGGSSRKEVHAQVRINNELGVRQFARLNFDYNRSFENIEVPFVRITHVSGGTADILPSAVTDQPNPAVVHAPAYQEVRRKTVRILGLQPGDHLEYRVLTLGAHHPLAPDFWLDHSFDRSGVVSQEIFELDLPASRQVQLRINPATPASSTEKSGDADSARTIYRWQRSSQAESSSGKDSNSPEADIVATTFSSWAELADRVGHSLLRRSENMEAIAEKEKQLISGREQGEQQLMALYDFVSQKISTIDLPLGSTGFHLREPSEILSSGYATPEDKFALFAALINLPYVSRMPLLVPTVSAPETHLPFPPLLAHLVTEIDHGKQTYYLDPSAEVAPFGVIPSNFRGKPALALDQLSAPDTKWWTRISADLPFPASQRVNVDARLASDGTLTAKVHYALRGDNELLLRVAFHQTPKEKWKDIAQLLALSDGFRGQVSNVDASDPYATREPFTVEYEIVQPKFVDWSKKPVRIPALLPQLGLPDSPAKLAPGAASSPIDLGTPLDVETTATLHLPSGTTPKIPAGASVQRDYATYASRYTARGLTLTAARHLNFILREVPAARAADYNAFLRVVQNDETQDFTLERTGTTPAKTKPAAPSPAAPPKTAPSKP